MPRGRIAGVLWGRAPRARGIQLECLECSAAAFCRSDTPLAARRITSAQDRGVSWRQLAPPSPRHPQNTLLFGAPRGRLGGLPRAAAFGRKPSNSGCFAQTAALQHRCCCSADAVSRWWVSARPLAVVLVSCVVPNVVSFWGVPQRCGVVLRRPAMMWCSFYREEVHSLE